MLLKMLVRRKTRKFPLPLVLTTEGAMLLLHTCILLGMVAGSTYAGTSNLFAAYLAGAAISWADTSASSLRGSHDAVDGNCSRDNEDSEGSATGDATALSSTWPNTTRQATRHDDDDDATGSAMFPSGMRIYERFYAEPLRRILQPFFFVRGSPVSNYQRGN